MTDSCKVFISYSRDEQPIAREIAKVLDESGYETWAAWEGKARTGSQWQNEIEKAIRAADSILILLNAGPTASPWQEIEWQAALSKTWSDSNTRLVPVIVGPGEPPPFLRNWQFLRIQPNTTPSEWKERLVEAVGSGVKKVTSSTARENQRVWKHRLAEISRAAHQMRKGEPKVSRGT